MKQLFFYALLVAFLSGCATQRAARKFEAAQKKEAARKAALPPEEQLAELVQEHPELVGKTTRVVTKIEYVKVPGQTITVTVPAASTPETDKRLVDSLLQSATHQFKQADSAAFAQRLHTILAQRPQLSRDTVEQQVGPLVVKAWVDARGIVHISSVNKEQNIKVEKEVTETGPLQPVKIIEPTFWQTLWIAVKAWFWALIFLLILFLIWLLNKLRK
ncbi:lipoprotein [Hymenobacter aerilatus]|uniref:Lipoprotein n=1 Tax=Hymenobacter aerilatus TaxID=2932251 RepID=A0A8T9SZ75_9BACT|nr:lipoprotein [Hymenobacter aerilatus]UOR06234.1 lipoprotein [Hymenobacter aerilatus]